MKNSTIFFYLFLALSPISLLNAQSTALLSGVVKDKITQEVLIGAAVKIEETNLGTTTDAAGRFRFEGLAPRTYNITVTYLGYTPLTRYNLALTSGNATNLTLEMDPAGETIGEVEISENRSVRIASIETPLSIQNLSTEEIRSNPGGNFDISRVVQVLPGVGGASGSVGGYRNDLIIRGGGPSENVFYLDGVEIPVINHFTTQGAAGGPTGILNVSFIEDATLSTSAFQARYDNALSSVLQFRQREGNPERFQGNFRLSASEVALTGEGPLDKNGRTTFLASARRSYLQLLFDVIGLPIRPNYWDFQFKGTHKINDKTTLTLIGVGAIDEFSFAAPEEATPENLYILNSVPSINQWSYTTGATLKRLVENGYWTVTGSRNVLDNRLDQFEDNYNGDQKDEAKRTLRVQSRETENKLRFELNKIKNNWKWSAGASAQYVEYTNNTFNRISPAVVDSNGQVIQNAVTLNFSSGIDYFRYGIFGQVNHTLFGGRLGLSLGIRTDGNTFTDDGNAVLKQLSPRFSVQYALDEKWRLNASLGRYFKIAPYPLLGYRDEFGNLSNQNLPYLRSDHFVAGLEYIPSKTLRFTLEGFLKNYGDYPVTVRDGISIANQGSDFGIVGNEAVRAVGTGESYGLELFAQQKLNKNFYFTGSYTLFWSKFSNAGGDKTASAWDNRHLISLLAGVKLKRNWEMGLKYRFQGGAPLTPFDLEASRINYLVRGRGTLDFSRLNSERLNPFSQLDLRIDKKWNFRKSTFDLFLDIQNLLATPNPSYPNYTFRRNADNTGFLTTDGQPLRADASNAQPLILDDTDSSVLPTIGFIFEM